MFLIRSLALAAALGMAPSAAAAAAPAAAPRPVPASPSGKTTFHATRQFPFEADATLDGDGTLALKAPSTGKPAPVLPKKDDFVGVVSSGSRFGEVYVRGAPIRSKKGLILLPLRVEGLSRPGTYEGALDIANTGAPADAVSVKVDATDAWWSAVAALLLGTALVLWPQALLRRWRPERDLHARHRALEAAYQSAEEDFVRYFPDYAHGSNSLPGFSRPSKLDVADYAAGVDEAIRDYARSTLYFDTTADAYKKLDGSLRLAEDDASCLGDTGGFGKSLVELEVALKRLAAFLNAPSSPEASGALGSPFSDREPALALAGASVLRGAVLKVGAAKARSGQADEYTTLIAAWRTMAQSVKRYELWALALVELDRKHPDDMSMEDRELLRSARGKVYEAKSEMLDVTDAASLSSLGTAKKLDAAHGALASLGGIYRVWVPPLEEPLEEAAAAPVKTAVALLSADSTKPLTNPPPPEPHDVGRWVERVDSMTVKPARPVAVRKTRRWVGDASVVVVTLATSVVAALDAFYFGKAWGTTEDYLTVIFVGTGAQAVAKSLTGAVTQLLGGTAAPPAKTDPQAATAET